MSAVNMPGFDADHLRATMSTEYFKILDIVQSFDQRLLTIKGWSVTLSLASLGLGFQQGHYGLFLVAAASGFAFWLIEVYTKDQQLHYYPRMRDIEATCYELFGASTTGSTASTPLIDWSWETAEQRIRKGARYRGDPRVPQRYPYGQRLERSMQPWRYLHVAFPHVVAVILGAVLFALGAMGFFGPI